MTASMSVHEKNWEISYVIKVDGILKERENGMSAKFMNS
jgi:hypothetical protein